jgi:hypothetical protein
VSSAPCTAVVILALAVAVPPDARAQARLRPTVQRDDRAQARSRPAVTIAVDHPDDEVAVRLRAELSELGFGPSIIQAPEAAP